MAAGNVEGRSPPIQSQRGASPQRRPPQGTTYRKNHRAKFCPKLAVPPRWAYRKAKGATSRPRITNLEIPGNVLPSWRAVNRGSRGLVLWWFRVILGIDHSRGHSLFVQRNFARRCRGAAAPPKPPAGQTVPRIIFQPGSEVISF